jgi:two-component system LytT family response regulator
MLKALLVDDEERATDALQRLIGKFIPVISQVMVCNDARHANKILQNYQPDLLFLDICMPHISGFDLLGNMCRKQCKVIFTTAFNEYAIKAIRFSAFDYLLKPIDPDELVQSVQRFIKTGENYIQQQALLQNIMSNMQAAEYARLRLALPTSEGVHYVMPAEITRCEALDNYTKFYLTGNHQLIIFKTLREYEELLLPYHFLRTHRSHHVNRDLISFIDQEGFIILKDSTKVEVSRRRKDAVLAMLQGS